METKFSTSFIPKTTLEPVVNNTKKPLGLFMFVSLIIFFVSVVVAGGAFGWHKYLDSRKAQMKIDLEKNIKAFEPETIEEYVRLNKRIETAKDLLAKHVAVSYVFDLLTEKTLASVSFTDFKYSLGNDGVATLSMNGIAKSYNAVAFQSSEFGKERSLEGLIFSNLDLDASGNVVFNLATKINPGFIAYTRKAATAEFEPTDIVPLDEGGMAPTLPSESMTGSSDQVFPVVEGGSVRGRSQ